MEKTDEILLKQIKDNLQRGKTSSFLDRRELSLAISFLNKNKISYHIFYLFDDCDKVILYNEKEPDICLFKINSKSLLTNPAILGSLFSLNIDRHVFGDIINYQENFYFPCLSFIASYLKSNFLVVGNINVSLEEEDLSLLKDFQREYDKLEYIVSSTRIDIIVSRITNLSRKNTLELFTKKEVLLNYQVVSNYSSLLKEGDIFSIRKYGKYKYSGILRMTKSDKKVILLEKYK